MSPEQRNRLIEILASGEELSPEWSRILFPPEKREYELVYHGKDREEDIIANPKKIKILQVEAVQLVRAYDDADLVQGYPAYIRLSKTFDAESALLFDGIDHPEYVIQFVIQPKNKDDPRLAKFIDIYQHSPVVKASLDKTYGTLYQPGWGG